MKHLQNDEKSIRKSVVRTLVWTTMAFFVLLWASLTVYAQLPAWRFERAERRLSAGDTDAARSLALRLRDEAQQQELLTRCDYADAAALLEAGDVSGAREKYARCGDWADAADMVRQCDYRLAQALFDAGDHDGAEAAFTALGGWSDARERAKECRYRKALELLEAGDKVAAGDIFASLGDYADTAALLRQIAVEFTGIADGEEALKAYQGLTPQVWEHLRSLAGRRETLPRGIADVGFYHTVGLGADGAVLACGDDSFGQCDVAGWQGAVAVAAGAYHTAALFPDGTVKAVGRNSEGQCDTGKWRDVVSLACGDYATFGVTAGGELLCAGYNKLGEAAQWSGLTAVSGGSYNLAALDADAAVWIWPRLEGQARLSGCVSLAVSTGYAVGAMEDGTVRATSFELSGWEDIVAVSAGPTAVLGLDLNGRVRGHFFRQRDAADLSGFEDAVALAAGGTHHILVFADGTAAVVGDTSHGEGEVAAWRLKVS